MAIRRAHIILSIVVVPLAVTLVAAMSAVQARVKAFAVLAESVGVEIPRPFASRVERSDAVVGDVTGHLYVPARDAPPVLVVPGAAPLGKEDPRVVRLARSLARAGRTVFVPDLALSEQRLDEGDVDRIVRAAVALSDRTGARGRVALLGFSYGGSFALLAAADPRLDDRLAVVATFGAYFDLVGVIQAAATGVSVVGDRRIPWQGHLPARTILHEHAAALVREGMREELIAALRGEADVGTLAADAAAIFDLVSNEDPSRTFALADRLPREARSLLRGFSPSTTAGSIDAPVAAMHSTDDPAVPYAELLRLRAGLPQARTVTVSAFRHVDLRASGPRGWAMVAGDAVGAWRFASWLLSAQE